MQLKRFFDPIKSPLFFLLILIVASVSKILAGTLSAVPQDGGTQRDSGITNHTLSADVSDIL